MSSVWQTIAIKDLGRVVTGRTPSSNNPEHFGNGYPFITPSDIALDNRHIKTERFVSEEGKESLERILLPKGAICFVCIGATIGKICVTSRPSFTNQQINSVIVDESKHDSRFAFYALSLQGGNAKALAGGAATPIINKSAFSEIEIEVPDLSTQRKIAGILSAYDDLIENNLRRIKILEEMAQSLYREWFVHFRFPGHESAKFVDSTLGQIPKGWDVVSFTELAEILGGGTPQTAVDEYWNGEIPFFSPKDAPSSFYVLKTEKTITEEGLRKCASKLFEKNTVFITARGTVGKVAMPSRAMAMNQSCYALRGKDGYSQQFLFLATKEQVSYLKKNTGGATFDTIIVDTFHRMLVVKPPLPLVKEFTTRIVPFIEAVNNLSKRNQTLRRTRDLLLPKLLSNQPPRTHD